MNHSYKEAQKTKHKLQIREDKNMKDINIKKAVALILALLVGILSMNAAFAKTIVTEEQVSSEEVWFDEGEARLKELKKQGWEPVPGRNAVSMTEGNVTTIVTNIPTGYGERISPEVYTSKKFPSREEAEKWIADNGLVQTNIERFKTTSTAAAAVYGYSTFEKAEAARIEMLNYYYMLNENKMDWKDGFIVGELGGVSDRVYKQNIFEWTDIPYMANIGVLTAEKNVTAICSTIRNRVAAFCDAEIGNVSVGITHISGFADLPLNVDVVAEKPGKTDAEYRFTMQVQETEDAGKVSIYPLSGRVRTKLINADTDDPEACEFDFYELRYAFLYQASGRKCAYGQRAELTVTRRTVEETPDEEMTPLEELLLSCTVTWQTEDGAYTCCGICLEDGTRATQYYSNETGELVATVPMR